jgi:integrase
MSVTIRYRKCPNNKEQVIYFDIYHDGLRDRVFKGLKMAINPINEFDKQRNKDVLFASKAIRNEIEQELLAGKHKFGMKKNKSITLIRYFDQYLSKYTKKDKRNIEGVKNRLLDFMNQKDIKIELINEKFVKQFWEFLDSKSKGEGASSYYSRFKKVIKSAQIEGLINYNPCELVKIKKNEIRIYKDTLTKEEIGLLKTAYCSNLEVKNAFLFSIYTGIRWCDVNVLNWSNIQGDIISFNQLKTGKVVQLPITDEIRPLLVKNNRDLVFNLPSHNGALKCLKKWVLNAGINKHITWHCARHTTGTIMSQNGTNAFIIAAGLGHSNLRHTNKYVRVNNDDLRKALSFT